VPDEGRAYHARGKSLLRLGRPLEAREAFERACLLSPKLVEAMLLRREADRSLKELRTSVGATASMTLDIPDHLPSTPELRDALRSGRIQEGIDVLRRVEHADDAAAQLLLADLLSFDARFDEALLVFDGATRLGAEHIHAALLGKARMLLDLDRAAQALTVFEHVIAERPDLGEALEGRARALKQLGRDAEAEEVFRQYVSTTARGSDLRVRASRGSSGAS
jgi:tetratricopeptide (TPR) repeat protein